MKPIFAFLFSILFFYGCETCDPSISLGDLPLTEVTKSFLPYNDTDTLVFMDEQGLEHVLTCPNGKDSSSYQMDVDVLCDAGLSAAPQLLFYNIELQELAFTDTAGNGINIKLYTTFEDASNVDSIAIFDCLEIVNSNPQTDFMVLSIPTDYQLNVPSNGFLAQGYNFNQFIGDTTLYGKAFQGVYSSEPANDAAIFYNKSNGVVAIRFSEDAYWVLKD